MILFIQLKCHYCNCTWDNSKHQDVFYYAAFTPKLRTAIHMFFEAEILRIVAGVLHIGNLARNRSVAESHCEKIAVAFRKPWNRTNTVCLTIGDEDIMYIYICIGTIYVLVLVYIYIIPCKGLLISCPHIRQHNYPIPIFRSHFSDAQATSPSVRRWAVPWQVGSTCWPLYVRWSPGYTTLW